MKLRPYQKTAINSAVNALIDYGNTLCVAPTGAGKTVILAGVIDETLKIIGERKRALVLIHRTKINFQNEETFKNFCGRKTSFFISGHESLAGQVVFGMIQTLTVNKKYKMLPAFDLIIIDEGHHCVADSYNDLIDDQKKKNPKIKIMGISATPDRSDDRSLIKHFDNIAFQIKLKELIELDYLVRPVVKAFDFFVEKERSLISNSKYWCKPIEQLSNEIWESGRKKIVIFCASWGQLEFIKENLEQKNIKCASIVSRYSDDKVRDELREFEQGQARVLLNIDIATEGYDYPPIDCVVLMRATTTKSMLIQMVGRGLRTIDSRKYPDYFKNDCLVLDFGQNFKVFGSLEQEVVLEEELIKLGFKFKKELQDERKRELKGLLEEINIYYKELYDKGHFETFNYEDKYIKGLCGFNKSLFIIDDKIFYKNSTFVKQIENKEELEGLAELLINDNKDFFDSIRNEHINDYQIGLLIKDFNIIGCSRYRASVLINFLINKEKYV